MLAEAGVSNKNIMSSQIGGPPQPQTPSAARARPIEPIVTVLTLWPFLTFHFIGPTWRVFLASTGVKTGTAAVIGAHRFGDFVLRAWALFGAESRP